MKYLAIVFVMLAVTGVAWGECPEGYVYNNSMKKCEIPPMCPPGFTIHPEHDICNMKPSNGTCPQGSVYNASEKMCETTVICPAGTVFNGDIEKCLKN